MSCADSRQPAANSRLPLSLQRTHTLGDAKPKRMARPNIQQPRQKPMKPSRPAAPARPMVKARPRYLNQSTCWDSCIKDEKGGCV